MNLFGKRKAAPPPEVSTLLARMDALERAFRSVQLEWEDVYARVHKAMRRAVVAERNQERRATGAAPAEAAPPALPSRPPNLYGARGRIYVRQLEAALAERGVVPPPRATPGPAAEVHANGNAEAQEGE